MINLVYVLILLGQLQIFATQKLNELCTTTDAEPGVCTHFSTCNSLKKFKYSADNICDESANEVVCCKILPEPITECGTISSLPKITNGTVTPILHHPWAVPLFFKATNGSVQMQCGGSLISKRYVLTAAHCVHKSALTEWKLENIKLGVWDLSVTRECSENGEICADHASVGIEKIIIHENFNPNSRNREHDIALLRLEKDIEYSDFTKPICLPPKLIIKKSVIQIVTAVGWGRTENGTISNKKMNVNLFINKLQKCATKYSSQIINEYQICAAGNRGKDTCDGDSGGPLIAVDNYSIPDGSYQYLTGIVSYGPPICGLPRMPGVYTNVSMYIPWIKNQLHP